MRDNVKISENFHFDLTHPDEFHGNDMATDIDIISKSFEAIFTVEFPHEEIYLVLNVEKALQGDLNSIADLYTKQGDKVVQKQAESAKTLLAKSLKIGGIARMPFVWAARQVFPKSNLDLVKPFSNFFKHEAEKLRSDEFIGLVGEYHNFTNRGGKFKYQLIPGEFKCSFKEFTEGPPTVTHDLLYYKPMPDPNMKPRRDVLAFKMPGRVSKYCNTEFHNYLYVYPLAVNFTAKKAATNSKSRNIMIRIQVFESTINPQQQNGLEVIFGKSSARCISSSATTAVSYHNKTPTFNEEVKIKVPAGLTDRHHVFFTFYHVAVDDKKPSKTGGEETIIGYSWLPLFQDGVSVADGNHDLMVAYAGANLPENYVMTRSLGMGQTAGPKITWIDATKPIFNIKVARVSSIALSDPAMSAFFDGCAMSKTRDHKLVNCIKALHAAQTDTIISNSAVLFNQLLTLLCGSVSASVDDVSLNAVRFVIHAVSLIHEEMRGSGSSRNIMLRSYSYHVATAPTVDSRQRPLFSELTKYLLNVMKDKINIRPCAQFVKHSWFFFSIISKAMAQHAATFAPGTSRETGQPSARFSLEFNETLQELIMRMAGDLAHKSKSDLELVKSTNLNIALFMLDCFAVMDRGFVLVMLQKYLDGLRPTNPNQSGADFLILCKIQFLEVICTYEHYVAMNLPFEPASADEGVSQLDLGYRRRHCLAGVMLDLVKELLSPTATSKQLEHRQQAIKLLRTMLAKHDGDPRYSEHQGKLSRIAMLYFPVVHMVLDVAPRIHGASPGSRQPAPFSDSESRDLLICFLWIVKNSEARFLHHFWNHGSTGVGKMLDVLSSCMSTFQYLGRERIDLRRESNMPTSDDRLEALEAAMSGGPTGIPRRNSSSSQASERTTPSRFATTPSRFGRGISHDSTLASPMSTLSNLGSPVANDSFMEMAGIASTGTLQKDAGRRFKTLQKVSRGGATKGDVDMEVESGLLANLCMETSLVVIKLLNQLMYHFSGLIQNDDGRSGGSNPVTWRLVHLLTLFLHCGETKKNRLGGQCGETLEQYFRTLILFVNQYDSILFHREEEYSQKLAVRLLTACNSELPALRDRAGAAVYALLKINFAGMSAAITTAVSQVAGESRSDRHLRASLSSILACAAAEPQPPTPTFSSDLHDLINRLIQVLRDTAEMQHNGEDVEMQVDLMCRIADTYSNTPHLRVIWLEKVADIHIKEGNWAEAAMSVSHCAAVIAEHLKEDFPNPLNIGCNAFRGISPNLCRETTPAEYRITKPLFSENGIQHVLKKAVDCFKKAQLFELVSKCDMLYFPMLEAKRKYEELAAVASDMHACFEEIVRFKTGAKMRFLGTYFRVGFFGAGFSALDGAEFIYKEPSVTPLSEIVLRLETLYGERFGHDHVTIVRDSKAVDTSKFKPKDVSIQVTKVEPYTKDGFEGDFAPHDSVNKFIFETPYTKGGKAHGSAATQCKRKTIIQTIDNLSFPYIKRRLRVGKVYDEEMEPLDVAIEEMSNKVKELATVVDAKPPDMVMLQMQLQGIVSIQVNAGPMEYASVFLQKAANYDAGKITRLQEEFAFMVMHLERGIGLNASLVSSDQAEYHDDLKGKFDKMRETLHEMIGQTLQRVNADQVSARGAKRNVFDEISGASVIRHSFAPVNFLADEEGFTQGIGSTPS